MFSAWPLSGRSPVAGSTSAYLTDELPELSTRTRPAEPDEPAMAGMLPGAGYAPMRRQGQTAGTARGGAGADRHRAVDPLAPVIEWPQPGGTSSVRSMGPLSHVLAFAAVITVVIEIPGPSVLFTISR